MELMIGKRIKDLRRKQDITQEKLANYLNVSYQAVSKWENQTAYPDISMLPMLANFFGVTVDELLDLSQEKDEAFLKKKEKQIRLLIAEGKTLEGIELAKAVLQDHPKNYPWMGELANQMYMHKQAHPEWNENAYNEIIELCERILEDCTQEKIRNSATQTLCYVYPKTGQLKRAKELVETLPSMWACRELHCLNVCPEEELVENIQICLFTAVQMIVGNILIRMGNCSEYEPQDRIAIFEKAVDLIHVVFGGDVDCLGENQQLASLYGFICIQYYKQKEMDKAREYWEKGIAAARRYDDTLKSGVQRYRSLIMNRVAFNPDCRGRNYEGTELDHFLGKMKEQGIEFQIET